MRHLLKNLLLLVLLALAGCASAPTMSVVQAPPRPTRYAAAPAMPDAETRAVVLNSTERMSLALKIRRAADNVTVWRLALAEHYAYDPDASFYSTTSGSIDGPFERRDIPTPGDRPVPLPLLPAGDYVLELWQHGQRVSTEPLAVAESPAAANPMLVRAALAVALHPILFGRPDDVAEREVQALDAVVGLTAAQRRAARNAFRQALQGQRGPWGGPRAAIGRDPLAQARKALRAELTPEQLNQLDDDGSPFSESLQPIYVPPPPEPIAGQPGSSPAADRIRQAFEEARQLRSLLHLTSPQNTQVLKLLIAQSRALANVSFADEQDAIRDQTRNAIRALLTEDQRKLYDDAPARLGPGQVPEP